MSKIVYLKIIEEFGLVALAEEISRQPGIDCVVWFSMITLLQIYNEEEQVGQGEIPSVQFEEKRSIRKCNAAKFKEMKSLKKKQHKTG